VERSRRCERRLARSRSRSASARRSAIQRSVSSGRRASDARRSRRVAALPCCCVRSFMLSGAGRLLRCCVLTQTSKMRGKLPAAAGLRAQMQRERAGEHGLMKRISSACEHLASHGAHRASAPRRCLAAWPATTASWQPQTRLDRQAPLPVPLRWLNDRMTRRGRAAVEDRERGRCPLCLRLSGQQPFPQASEREQGCSGRGGAAAACVRRRPPLRSEAADA
jgi:hypothetical protein